MLDSEAFDFFFMIFHFSARKKVPTKERVPMAGYARQNVK
jgi:hypothetical protein